MPDDAVMCRGWSNLTDWGYVVKIAWPSTQGPLEGSLLKLAKGRDGTGIAKYSVMSRSALTANTHSISHLRQDIEFLD